jgi:hypothetical protein
MAHEGLAIVLLVLGSLLLLGYQFGPNREVRMVKRVEGKVMLVPTGLLLYLMAAIIWSGILG